ncbi:hypothetical protein [Rhodococcoides fascians]|uniref:hypothetical protein n=1 Tax=Rhodococcoides fascians TaxID=1828 RepID=UPI0006895A9A|nr:hypothetical protein [Rhodococcus fascians]
MGDDHLFVSRATLREIGELLSEIPGLLEELEVSLLRQDRIGKVRAGNKRTKPSEFPIPFSISASEAAEELHNVLVTWVRMICEQRGIEYWPSGYTHLSAFIGPLQEQDRRIPHGYVVDADVVLVRWLTDHLMSLGMTEGAHEALGEIGDAVTAVRWIICPPIRQRPQPTIERLASVRALELNANGIAALARELVGYGSDEYRTLNRRRVKYMHQAGWISPVLAPKPGYPLMFHVGTVLDVHVAKDAEQQDARVSA